MPIEINYFAFEEKWTSEEEHKAYYNLRYPIEKRLKSGHCVASIGYSEGLSRQSVVYDLLAEDKDVPISIVSRIFFDRGTHIWDTASISPNIANDIHNMLKKVKPPQTPKFNGTTDIWASEDRLQYEVLLDHTYNNINFRYDTEYDRRMNTTGVPINERWMQHIDWIVDLCEDLTGNKLRHPNRTKEASETFRLLFRKKSKHAKYQGKWTKPKLPDYVSKQHILDKFQDKDLRDSLALKLDFKFYLPNFMYHIDLIEFTFQKLTEAEVSSWDTDEQDIVQDYFTAFWDYVLYYYPSLWGDSYTFIRGVHLTGLDVAPHIKFWKASMDDISASRHLAGYVRSLYAQYVESGADVFDDVPKIMRRWLRDVGEGDYFLKRYMEYDGVRPFADEYAEASEMLSLLHAEGL